MAKVVKQRVLRPGVTIGQKYRIDKPIARGGFSVIYRGTHTGMDRPVALKLLELGDQIRPAWLDRFGREARLASQLTHPNTVTIFDYGKDERGFLYIVMEWVEGQSLYHLIQDVGALDPGRVAHITMQILQSLGEAHARGFLHRDLKPSNIMLTTDFEGAEMVKVLDFGIAKIFEDTDGVDVTITQTGAFVGTPRYAAPEQLEKKKLTPAADIYAVGLLMWEGLVGDPAVASLDFTACSAKHLSPQPWRLPAAVGCPQGLANIVHRALRKDRDERYQSCREMFADLQRWVQSSEDADAGTPWILRGDADERRGDDLFDSLLGPPDDLDVPLDLLGPARDPVVPSGETELDPDDFLALDDLPAPRDDGEAAARWQDRLEARSPDRRRERPGDRRDNRPDSRPQPASAGPPIRPKPRSSGGLSALMDDLSGFNWITVGAGIVMGLGIVGVWAAMTLSDAPEAPDAPPASDEQVAASSDDEATPGAAGAEAPAEEAGAPSEDPGSPSFSSGALLTALQSAGWRQTGDIHEMTYAGVDQLSVRMRKRDASIHVTIYEAISTPAEAESLVESTERPKQAMRFGTTVVRLAPGEEGGSTRGLNDALGTLFTLKSIAQEKAGDEGSP